jgi:hypothetical protein
VPTGTLIAVLAFALYLAARRGRAHDVVLTLVAITGVVGLAVELADRRADRPSSA